MSTLKNLVDEIILERKKESLELFYNIDVFIQEFKDDENKQNNQATTPQLPAPQEAPNEPNVPNEQGGEEGTTATQEQPAEGFDEQGELLTEAIIKVKSKGQISVQKQDAMNIQTLQDLLDYLTDVKINEQTIVEKVLDKKGSKGGKKLLSDELQEIILILTGNGGDKKLADIIDKGDKVIIELDYGIELLNSIGFKINKNAGTDIFTVMLKKNGKILPGNFDLNTLNKYILYYRNTLVD